MADSAKFRSVDKLKSNIETIVKIAKERSSFIVLSTFAVSLPSTDSLLLERIKSDSLIMEHFWGSADAAVEGVRAHNKVMKDIASLNNIPLVKIADMIPHDSNHFLDLCHMKAKSCDIIAKALSDVIM